MSKLNRGYFEIGVFNTKCEMNIGTLWRSAYQLGAIGIFTINKRYKTQASDTTKTSRHIPLRHFLTFDEFQKARSNGAMLIGIEQNGIPIETFTHPEKCIYLLGAEDNGLPEYIKKECQAIVSLSSIRTNSFNVAVAGSIVMYHRLIQRQGLNV